MTLPMQCLMKISTSHENFSDILTHIPITTSNGLYQFVILNLQIGRNPIELRRHYPLYWNTLGHPITDIDILDIIGQIFHIIYLLDGSNHPGSIVMDHIPFRLEDICIDQRLMSSHLPDLMKNIIFMIGNENRAIIRIGILIQSDHNQRF